MQHIKIHISGVYRIAQELRKYQALGAQFFMYALGMICMRGITLLFAPITMFILSPEDYGLLALANGFISVLTACLGLGLRQALPFYYFQYTDASRNRLLRAISITYLLYILPFLIIALGNISACNRYFFLHNAPLAYILICFFIASIYFFVELIYQLLQYHQESKKLIGTQIGAACISITCNLFFLCVLQWGPISILLGQAIGMLFVLIVHKSRLLKPIFNHSSIDHPCVSMRLYIAQSLPFIPSMLCGVLLSSGDRWALAHISSLYNVGIYSSANMLAQFANMVILYALTGSYMPYLLKRFAEQKESINLIEKENKRIMWLCMATCFVLLCPTISLVKFFAYQFLPVKFHEAINYMGVLLIGSIFYLGIQFLNCLIQFHKKSLFLGSVLLIPSLLNIALNLILIPVFDIYGCVTATLIAYMIYFCTTFLYNRHLCRK